jgi:hypothetical protein
MRNGSKGAVRCSFTCEVVDRSTLKASRIQGRIREHLVFGTDENGRAFHTWTGTLNGYRCTFGVLELLEYIEKRVGRKITLDQNRGVEDQLCALLKEL